MEKLKNSVYFPFARSSSPKQKKKRTPDRRSRFAGYLNSSCLVIPPFSSLPSLLWWYIVCFHPFIAEG